MNEQIFLVMDDRDEHWKYEHPEEYAALESKETNAVTSAIIDKWKNRLTKAND